MTASQLTTHWHTLTPAQRASELVHGISNLIGSPYSSPTDEKLAAFMLLVVRLVVEQKDGGK